MENTAKHRFLNSALFTVLAVPLCFFLLRDTVAVLTDIMFRSIGGEGSFLSMINEDIARLLIAGLVVIVMPLFFRGRCDFGFCGGKVWLGVCLALPQIIVPIWNLLQIKVYGAPLVTGTAAVAAAVVHGIGPGVSEEVICRGFGVSNLMRIWKDKPDRVRRCMLASGVAFGLLHSVNVIATGDVTATLVQVCYTSAIGIINAAIYIRSRSLWGVIIMHTLTDITAFIAVFDDNVTAMDVAFMVLGSALLIALAFWFVRPAKRAEIDEIWADGWSFGNEKGKQHAGAKAAAIVSAVLAVAFVASLGVYVYRVKMGYDSPLFPSGVREPDKDVSYQISDDGAELTIMLPYTDGGKYVLSNSAPNVLTVKESRRSGDKYVFVFSRVGAGNEKVRLVFSLTLGESDVTFKDHSVTVSFGDDGRIAAVGG